MLIVSLVDVGPTPFRSLDVWLRDKRFLDFVRSKWQSYEMFGGGMFILKKKIKKLKSDLKRLNREVFGNVNQE